MTAAICLVPAAVAQPDVGIERSPTREKGARGHVDDRVDSQLAAVVAARAHGAQAALRTARTNGLEIVQGRIRVVVEASSVDARTAVAERGGLVEATAGNLIEALLPAASIDAVSTARGVERVRTPYPAYALGIESEGIASTAADAWQAVGILGAGAKVAVIDLGFAGLAGRQSAGELPAGLTAVDYCGGSMGGLEAHGTAVAEIVHEMAPAAELYAICVDTEVDLASAAAYAVAHDITIVNHSVGWFNSSRGDGSGEAGTPDAIVAAASDDGILWVNAAGNAAEEHWSGTWSDPDGNNSHNFDGSDEGNSLELYPDEEICAYLKWDAWPTTQQDFDFYLVDDAEDVAVAGSEGDQQGATLPPTEALCYANDSGVMQNLSLWIDRYSANTSPRFDLFVTIGDALEYENAAGSVVEPATSPSALAVGAVSWEDDAWEPYSSVGPTIDGRVKPDLAASSAVTSAIYDPDPFFGTSSAAPHVAGAAALLRGQFPLATGDELQIFLTQEAAELGAAGPDNFFGAGVLLLPASPPLVTTSATAGSTTTNSLGLSGTVSPRGLATTYRWQYGTTAAYGAQTAAVALASPRGGQAVTSTLSGLAAGTEYHYRLIATNIFGTSVGADRTNRTSAPLAPVVTTSAPEDVGSAQARLAARVTPNGTASTAWFEWGATTEYGSVTPVQSAGDLNEIGLAAEITGLVPTTEYHYRVVAENVYGTTRGADQAFTTTGGTLPVAATGSATAAGTTAMTLSGDVTPGGLPTTYQFEYRPEGSTVAPFTAPVAPAAAGYGSVAHGVTATTATIIQSFAYEYRLVATNALGSHAGVFRSVTIAPPAPPAPPPPAGGGGGGGGGGSLNLGVSISTAKTTLAPNETVEVSVSVQHKSGSLSATVVYATITLPNDATLLGSPAYDRGSGCVGTTTLMCNVDFLPPSTSAVIRFSLNAGAVGAKVVAARVTQSQTDTAAADSSASVSLDVRAPVTATPATGSTGSTGTLAKVITGNARANTLNGSPGRDIMRGLGGNDRLFGRGGADRLFGGLGSDRLVGGTGRDTIEGGPGNDLVESRDGARDVIRCGPGRDTVVADRLDWISRDCERSRRR